jgi:hypothetical protein
MMNGNDYDLSKLAYREWQERVNQYYEPLKVPAFVQRLLAALRGASVKRTRQSGVAAEPRPARTGAAAE